MIDNIRGIIKYTYARRHSPQCRYGIILLSGVTLAGIFLLVFAKISEDLLSKELGIFDTQVSIWVRYISSLRTTEIMMGITFLGSTAFLVSLAMIITGIFLHRGRPKMESMTVPIVLVGGFILDDILKIVFHRSRPVHMLVNASGWSFPSGHALVSFTFYGFLAYILWTGNRGKAIKITGSLILLGTALFIGISRIYLGVHFPSDVIAGYAAGGFWAVSCILGLETLRYNRE
ncbi:MAG: phosphatase PAP2 family protein [Bacillota bacterium]